MDTQKIFDHFYEQHGLTLLESEMKDIANLISPKEYPCGIGYSITKEAIDFGVYLCGHSREDIVQMYNSWVKYKR